MFSQIENLKIEKGVIRENGLISIETIDNYHHLVIRSLAGRVLFSGQLI